MGRGISAEEQDLAVLRRSAERLFVKHLSQQFSKDKIAKMIAHTLPFRQLRTVMQNYGLFQNYARQKLRSVLRE